MGVINRKVGVMLCIGVKVTVGFRVVVKLDRFGWEWGWVPLLTVSVMKGNRDEMLEEV